MAAKNVSLGLDELSFICISILSSSILLAAIITDLTIESPISLYSPVSGTIKPIFILSSDMLFPIKHTEIVKHKKNNLIKVFIFLVLLYLFD